LKTIYKVLIAGIIGLAVMWLCYQVLHLEQITTTVVSIIVTIAAFAVCDKIKGDSRKEG
jgi:putative flippase GtrA